MVLMREEEIIRHCISLRIIWKYFAQPLKHSAKAKTSLLAFEPEPSLCNPIFFAVLVARFSGHRRPETVFQSMCSFGPVVAALSLADSCAAVGGVLQVVAWLLMNLP